MCLPANITLHSLHRFLNLGIYRRESTANPPRMFVVNHTFLRIGVYERDKPSKENGIKQYGERAQGSVRMFSLIPRVSRLPSMTLSETTFQTLTNENRPNSRSVLRLHANWLHWNPFLLACNDVVLCMNPGLQVACVRIVERVCDAARYSQCCIITNFYSVTSGGCKYNARCILVIQLCSASPGYVCGI
jgi:hypothetical protein